MRHRAKQTAAVISAGLLLWLGLVAGPVPGAVATPGPVTVSQAQDRVAAAERALERAQARVREARRRRSATQLYSAEYGPAVGRYVWMARVAGYGWWEMPRLMRTIYVESRGDPAADGNPPYLGLLQYEPGWADGSRKDFWARYHLPALWDRTSAWESLRHGVHLGWEHWGY